MPTAYDLWLTTDPSDDGSQEAIEQIECDLARDASEVLAAAEWVTQPEGLIAAAFMSGTAEAWQAVRDYYETQVAEVLRNRAIDEYQARIESDRRMDYAA